MDPVFHHRGGGGGGAGRGRITMRQQLWLWPLPPSGPLRIYSEWPKVNLGLSEVMIDGEALIEAGAMSKSLWTD